MEQQLFNIISEAMKLFLRCGVRSITMDDIARDLRVSKKTLYKYVKDKSDLVHKAVKLHCESEQKISESICAMHDNAIDELFAVVKNTQNQLIHVHPAILYDLEKYHPDAWDVFLNHKKNFIQECVVRNLKKGITQGLYRKDMDIQIISRLYVSKIEMVFNQDLFPPGQFKHYNIISEMVYYHLRGIASEKGLIYIKDKIKLLKSEL